MSRTEIEEVSRDSWGRVYIERVQVSAGYLFQLVSSAVDQSGHWSEMVLESGPSELEIRRAAARYRGRETGKDSENAREGP